MSTEFDNIDGDKDGLFGTIGERQSFIIGLLIAGTAAYTQQWEIMLVLAGAMFNEPIAELAKAGKDIRRIIRRLPLAVTRKEPMYAIVGAVIAGGGTQLLRLAGVVPL